MLGFVCFVYIVKVKQWMKTNNEIILENEKTSKFNFVYYVK